MKCKAALKWWEHFQSMGQTLHWHVKCQQKLSKKDSPSRYYVIYIYIYNTYIFEKTLSRISATAHKNDAGVNRPKCKYFYVLCLGCKKNMQTVAQTFF